MSLWSWHPAGSILGIRMLVGPLPAVLILLGYLALRSYPLNQKRYEELQVTIREKENQQP